MAKGNKLKRINFDAEEKKFRKELDAGKFKIQCEPKCSYGNYTKKTQIRDSKAVEEFIKTDLFQDIINM